MTLVGNCSSCHDETLVTYTWSCSDNKIDFENDTLTKQGSRVSVVKPGVFAENQAYTFTLTASEGPGNFYHFCFVSIKTGTTFEEGLFLKEN